MSYTHLSEQERYVINHLCIAGFTKREIGLKINRHHSTISRELKRNGTGRWPDYHTYYWYVRTHRIALKRRCKVRHRQRQKNKRLVRYVESKLKVQWSPEEIAQRIRRDYPDDERMRISHETIYRWIYMDASLGGKAYLNLRRLRKKRCKQKRYGTGRRFLAGRKNIAERPRIVNGRQRFGDWEGDTVEGKKSSGYIATFVERKSRYLLAYILPNKKAINLTEQGVRAFRPIPRRMRHTLTVDNGSEFARFKEFEGKSGLDIYFAAPYSPW